MLLRFSLLALCLACADPASAQITLRADDTIPYQLGANTSRSTIRPNENGASTATVEALIAQSGPNQTWDFSTLASETFVGTAIVTDGDTGPGADADPYSQATQTYQLLLPPETDEDGNTIEGTVHGYYRIDSDGLHNLGIVITSTTAGRVASRSPSRVFPAAPSMRPRATPSAARGKARLSRAATSWETRTSASPTRSTGGARSWRPAGCPRLHSVSRSPTSTSTAEASA